MPMKKKKVVKFEIYPLHNGKRMLSPPYWSTEVRRGNSEAQAKAKADAKAEEFKARKRDVEVVRNIYEFEEAYIPGLSDIDARKR